MDCKKLLFCGVLVLLAGCSNASSASASASGQVSGDDVSLAENVADDPVLTDLTADVTDAGFTASDTLPVDFDFDSNTVLSESAYSSDAGSYMIVLFDSADAGAAGLRVVKAYYSDMSDGNSFSCDGCTVVLEGSILVWSDAADAAGQLAGWGFTA